VLNHFSACLLLNFAEDSSHQEGAFWADEYPYGTQSVGTMIDSMLHKTFKYLHGFVLSSGMTNDPKECTTTAGSLPYSKSKVFKPENAAAAAFLYRCISRTYSQSRKSPPKIALELVLSALPDALQTERRIAMNRFLYSNDDDFNIGNLPSMVSDASNLEQYFDEQEYGALLDCDEQDGADVESMQVRRLVAAMMAQGALPQYQDSADQNEIRSQSVHREGDFSKKFSAIVEDLLLSNIKNVQGWYKASQCLISKCEIVADRIGLCQGYCRNSIFFTPDKAPISKTLLGSEDLQRKQERDSLRKTSSWTEHLGDDLSLFVRHLWSSTPSLLQLEQAIKLQVESSLNNNDGDDVLLYNPHLRVIEDLGLLFSQGGFAKWQYSWGGIFVSSLRKIARRCLCMALYLAQKDSNEPDKNLFVAEITESLGVLLYSELSCSQTYGFPIHAMPFVRKRELATAALACFQTSGIAASDSSETKNAGRVTWDIHFMQGKVSSPFCLLYPPRCLTNSIVA
jgi:hypothetical protein